MNNILKDEFPFAQDILKGYTALICGASKGIGRSSAKMLARAGATIIACARNENDLKDLISNLDGENHKFLVMDLEDIDTIENNITK
jgi:3-oxoacyl-[acyl-carrier protein] reductase